MRGNELLQGLVGFGVLNFWITAALGFAWIMARAFRRRAAIRHLIRLIALMALLTLPVLARLSPAHYPLRVPLPAAVSKVALSFVAPRHATYPVDRSGGMPTGAGSDVKTPHRAGPDTNWRLVAISLVALWVGGAFLFALRPFVAFFGMRNLHRNSGIGRLAALDQFALDEHVGLRRGWELRFDRAGKAPTAMWPAVYPRAYGNSAPIAVIASKP